MKLKLSLLITMSTTLLVSLSLSAAELSYSSETEGRACVDCSTIENRDAYSEPTAAEALFKAAAEITRLQEKMNHADLCEKFAGEEGLGRYGRIISEEVIKKEGAGYKYNQLMQGPPDLVRACPAFTTMNEDQKAGLYVLIVNAMANYESSCNINETARGPNGKLIGLLQLHYQKEHQYSRGCQQGDASKASTTFSCGFSMLNDQVRRDGVLFSSKSYWDVLRLNSKTFKAKKIVSTISKYEPCQPTLQAVKMPTRHVALE